jgi:spore germination protein
MFSSNDRISVRQLRLLLILDLFSTTSLVLPRIATESAGRDAWISVILGTLIAIVYAVVILHLIHRFPRQTLFEYSEKLVGRFVTMIIGFAFIIKLILSAAFGVRFFAELIKETLLRETPVEIIVMSMLLVTTYIARKGFEARARVVEIMIWFVFIPIVLVLIFALPDVELSNVMPVFVNDTKDILWGAYYISLTYSALDLLLIANPYTDQPRKTKRPILFSVIFVGLFNLAFTLITLGLFGATGTQRQIWPVMNIMQVVNIPGGFIERQDALMISFWIMSLFAVINAYIFFISVITQRLFKLKEQNFLVLPFLPIIFLISLIPDNVVQVYEFTRNIMTYVGLIFLVGIPLLLIFLAHVRKEGEVK